MGGTKGVKGRGGVAPVGERGLIRPGKDPG